ncbi:MAG: hypothetical protein QM490_04195 [Candidatus Gracilibacteria bacterium]
MTKFKKFLKITGLPVLFASLCCVSPIILLLFGLGSLTFVSSLADTLYGDFKWYFRLFGLFLLAISLIIYFRKKGICTLDQVKKERTKIINTILIALIAGILGYMFFLYVIVHYIGVFLKIWE